MSDLAHTPDDNELNNIPAEEIEATGMYDIDIDEDISNLYATKEDAAELVESGQVGQEFMLKASEGGGGGKKYDNSWSYHRTFRIGKNEFIDWKSYPTAAEKKEGMVGEELDVDDPDQQFVAVRGIVLGYHWGAALQGQHDSMSLTVCRTTGLIEKLPTKNRTTTSNHPFKQPVTSMDWSNAKPTTPNWFFQNNPQLLPLAERYDVSKAAEVKADPKKYGEYFKSGVARNCLDCIKSGENRYHFDDGEGKCKTEGYILIAVFQLGRKNKTNHNLAPFENRIDIDWIDVADAGLKDYRGDDLDRPFILRLDRVTKSMLESVGDGKFDIPVKLPKHFDSNRRKTHYLPNDTVMSCGQFYQWLHAKGSSGDRMKMHKNGFAVYPVMTELYSAKLKTTTYTKDYSPVFNPVELEENGTFGGIHIDHYVNTALIIARQEAALSSGKEVSFAKMESIGATPTKVAAVAAAQEDDSAAAPEAAAPSRTMSSLAENAFSVKPKAVAEDEDDDE